MDQPIQGATARYPLAHRTTTAQHPPPAIETMQSVPSYAAVHASADAQAQATSDTSIGQARVQPNRSRWPAALVSLGNMVASWPRVASVSITAVRKCLRKPPSDREMVERLLTTAGPGERGEAIAELLGRILRETRSFHEVATALRTLVMALSVHEARPDDLAQVMHALHTHRDSLHPQAVALISWALAMADQDKGKAKWKALLQPLRWWLADRTTQVGIRRDGGFVFLSSLCRLLHRKNMDPALAQHIQDLIVGPFDEDGSTYSVADRMHCRSLALKAYVEFVLQPPALARWQTVEEWNQLWDLGRAIAESRCSSEETHTLLAYFLGDASPLVRNHREHHHVAGPIRRAFCTFWTQAAASQGNKRGTGALLRLNFRWASAAAREGGRQNWLNAQLRLFLETWAAVHPADLHSAVSAFHEASDAWSHEGVERGDRPMLLRMLARPDFAHARACARELYADLVRAATGHAEGKSDDAAQSRDAFVLAVARRLQELLETCPRDMEAWRLALLVHEAVLVVGEQGKGEKDVEHLVAAVVLAGGRFAEAQQRLMVQALSVGWGRLDPKEKGSWAWQDTRLEQAFKRPELKPLTHAAGMARMRYPAPVDDSDRMALLHMACRLGDAVLPTTAQLARVQRIIPLHARSEALQWIARESLPELVRDERRIPDLGKINEDVAQVFRALLEPLVKTPAATSQTTMSAQDSKKEVAVEGLDEDEGASLSRTEHLDAARRWWCASEDAAGLRFVHGLQDNAESRERALKFRPFVEAALVRTVEARKDIVTMLGDQREASEELLVEVTRFEQALEHALGLAGGQAPKKPQPTAMERHRDAKAEFHELEALLDSDEHDPPRLQDRAAGIAHDEVSWAQDADVAGGVVRRIAQHAARRSAPEVEALMTGVAPRLSAHRAGVMSAINEEAPGLDAPKRRALFTGLRVGSQRDKSD